MGNFEPQCPCPSVVGLALSLLHAARDTAPHGTPTPPHTRVTSPLSPALRRDVGQSKSDPSGYQQLQVMWDHSL